MDRYYDRVESLHFWDGALDDPEGDPTIIARIVAAVVAWALEDPYRAEAYPDGIRILHSGPVVHEGITYAYRVAYTVEDYLLPRDGKSGVITLVRAEPYDAGELLYGAPEAARDH